MQELLTRATWSKQKRKAGKKGGWRLRCLLGPPSAPSLAAPANSQKPGRRGQAAATLPSCGSSVAPPNAARPRGALPGFPSTGPRRGGRGGRPGSGPPPRGGRRAVSRRPRGGGRPEPARGGGAGRSAAAAGAGKGAGAAGRLLGARSRWPRGARVRRPGADGFVAVRARAGASASVRVSVSVSARARLVGEWVCARARRPAGGAAVLAFLTTRRTEPCQGSCRRRRGRGPCCALDGQCSAGPARVTRRWPRSTWVGRGSGE